MMTTRLLTHAAIIAAVAWLALSGHALGANRPTPGPREQAYPIGQHPPPGALLWSNGPGYAATLLPEDFVRWSMDNDIPGCEASWDAEAWNRETNMRGRWQVWGGHAPEMVRMGLDWMREEHRVWFAGWVLWQRSGTQPWECR